MYKLTRFAPTIQYGNISIPVLEIIDPSDGASSGLNKMAAERIKMGYYSPEVKAFIDSIEPDPGFLYMIISALTAGESWSCNENGDWFSREELRRNHPTFVSSAFLFKDHKNKASKDPIFGKPVFSNYNDKMDRVELISSVSKHKQARDGINYSNGEDIIERVLSGDTPTTSMGTRVPYDICSYCHNKAPTAKEYCEHLHPQKMNLMGRYLNGIRIYAINPNPHFFDISIVGVNADKTSFMFEKVANRERDKVELSAVRAERIMDKEAGHDTSRRMNTVVGGESIETWLRNYWNRFGGKSTGITFDFLHDDIDRLPHFSIDDVSDSMSRSGAFMRPHEFMSKFMSGYHRGLSEMFLSGIVPDPSEFKKELSGHGILLAAPGKGVRPMMISPMNHCMKPSAIIARIKSPAKHPDSHKNFRIVKVGQLLSGIGGPSSEISKMISEAMARYGEYIQKRLPEVIKVNSRELGTLMAFSAVGAAALDKIVEEKTMVHPELKVPGDVVFYPGQKPERINFNTGQERAIELAKIIDGRTGIDRDVLAKVAASCVAVASCFQPVAELKSLGYPVDGVLDKVASHLEEDPNLSVHLRLMSRPGVCAEIFDVFESKYLV